MKKIIIVFVFIPTILLFGNIKSNLNEERRINYLFNFESSIGYHFYDINQINKILSENNYPKLNNNSLILGFGIMSEIYHFKTSNNVKEDFSKYNDILIGSKYYTSDLSYFTTDFVIENSTYSKSSFNLYQMNFEYRRSIFKNFQSNFEIGWSLGVFDINLYKEKKAEFDSYIRSDYSHINYERLDFSMYLGLAFNYKIVSEIVDTNYFFCEGTNVGFAIKYYLPIINSGFRIENITSVPTSVFNSSFPHGFSIEFRISKSLVFRK